MPFLKVCSFTTVLWQLHLYIEYLKFGSQCIDPNDVKQYHARRKNQQHHHAKNVINLVDTVNILQAMQYTNKT